MTPWLAQLFVLHMYVCVCVNVNLSADSAVIQIWCEIITFSVKLLINTHVWPIASASEVKALGAL